MTPELAEAAIEAMSAREGVRLRGTAYHGDTPFDVPLFTKVTDGLWQGGDPATIGRLPDYFEHVVNLFPGTDYAIGRRTTMLTAMLYDSSDVPDRGRLELLADHVRAARRLGPTLVHCQVGLNRSSLVLGLALIRDGEDPEAAIALLRSRRCSAVLCNRTFERYLRGYAVS